MSKKLEQLALVITLGSGLALAQGMGQQPQSPSTQPPAVPQTQSPSASPDSTQPATSPSSTGDVNATKGQDKDQDKDKDKDKDSKLPQSDNNSMANGSGDVQNNIQSALQKDPSLSSANVNVKVNGKKVELTGTVPNKDAKEAAERIAKENSGGMKVKDHLKVAAADKDNNHKDSDHDKMANPK